MRPITLLVSFALALTIALLGIINPVYAAPTGATITIDTTADTVDVTPGDGVCADSNGDCSLRAAISEANALPGVDILNLPPGTYTLSRTGTGDNNNLTGDLDLNSEIILNGGGADITIIDAGQIDRAVHVGSAGVVTMTQLTLTNGQAPNGYDTGHGEDGGGVYNAGDLTLDHTTLSNNASGSGGDALDQTLCFGTPGWDYYCCPAGGATAGDAGHGGGVFNRSGAILQLLNSVLTQNRTGDGGQGAGGAGGGDGGHAGDGAGIYAQGTVVIRNATISGNATGDGGDGGGTVTDPPDPRCTEGPLSINALASVDGGDAGSGGSGGGIYVDTAAVSIDFTTIVANMLGTGGSGGAGDDGASPGVDGSDGYAGGFYRVVGSISIQDSIAYGNADRDCNGPISSGGYNRIGTTRDCTLAGTDSTADPGLASLGDNGGRTQTHALSSGSSAADVIPAGVNGCGTAVDHDQRGILRPSNGACDIGAYEYADSATLYVDADATGANTGVSWVDAFADLQDAIALAPAVAGTTDIWVAEGVYYPDEGLGQTDNDPGSWFELRSGLALYGGFDPGSGSDEFGERDWHTHVTVLSGDLAQDDTADSDGVVASTADIAGSNADHVFYNAGVDAGAIVDGFTITAGQANGSGEAIGGGMRNETASPTLRNLIVIGNLASYRGGGMSNRVGSHPALTNVVFSGNTTQTSHGGAIFNRGSSPSLVNVTIAGNHAGDRGGAMYNWEDSTPTLTNVIVWGNTAGVANAQIYNVDVDAIPVFSHSVVQGSGGSNSWDTALGTDDGNNIDVNPQFSAGYDDLRLLGTSPALDVGDNALCPDTDVRGLDRDDWGCDIGAYEARLTDIDVVSRTVSGGSVTTFGPTLAKVEVVDNGGCLTGLTIQRVESDHPDATEGIQTGRYWTITPVNCSSGFTLTLTLPYDTPGTTDWLCRYTGSDWDCGAESDHDVALGGPAAMPYTVIRQNIHALSDWAVGSGDSPSGVRLRAFTGSAPGHSTILALALMTLVLSGVAFAVKKGRPGFHAGS